MSLDNQSQVRVTVVNPETPFGGVQVVNAVPQNGDSPDVPDVVVGVTDFLALTDTPDSYEGKAGKLVTVNSEETALEFIASIEGGTIIFSAVDSVFGRTGAVTALVGDYSTFYELGLGVPPVSGYILASSSSGVRSWIPAPTGGGGGGVGGTGEVTITPLVSGQIYIDVVFSTAQDDALWELVVCNIVNTVDATPLNIWPGIITAKSTTGFRLQLNGAPDSANYSLHWALAGVAPTGGGGGSSSFIGLTDVPASYTGAAGMIAAVNSGETALEFIVAPTGGGGGSDVTAPTIPGGFTAEPIV